MDYFIHLAILVCIYTMLAQSLCIVAGYAGQLSLAHAGFYGIGAYCAALLSVNFGLSIIICLPVAMLFSGMVAFVVAKIAVRTIDDYFIIITLGIQVVIFSIFNNWQAVTNGPLGITAIPNMVLFGLHIESKIALFITSFVFMVTVWYVINNLVSSPFGRALKALSEDEIFSKSFGKNVHQLKVISFTISGILAAIPGVLYAYYIGYIDPTNFSIDESIFILSIVIIGGMNNLIGIFGAAAFLILLPEILRFIGMPLYMAANVRQIIYGIAIILVVFKYGKAK